MRFFFPLHCGQEKVTRRAAAYFAFDVQTASDVTHEGAYLRNAQASPVFPFGGKKRFKYPFSLHLPSYPIHCPSHEHERRSQPLLLLGCLPPGHNRRS